jgi:hypothetical protein
MYRRNSNNQYARAFYVKYCKILNKVRKEAKKQHNIRLRAKSNDKIKMTWNMTKNVNGKINLPEQSPFPLIKGFRNSC